MGSRFKNKGLGEIEADERGGAELGAAGGVSCFDVGRRRVFKEIDSLL